MRRVAASLLAMSCASLGAQPAYPSRPVTIVVPHPPGGSNDVFARRIARALGEDLGQTVVIDNKPGASGNIGTALVAKAAPDGHTLVAVSDLVSDQVQMLFASGPSLLPHARGGKLRAIGVTSRSASAIAPDLLPMASAVPGYEFELWWGVLAPAGTSADIVRRLNAAINKAAATPEMRGFLLAEGAEATPMTSAEFAAVIAADVPRWRKLAQQQSITPE